MRTVRGIVLLVVAAFLSLSACAGKENGLNTYDNNDLQLISAYTAKEMCSCLFVMQRDEAYCRAWTKESPAVADVRIDREKKTVESGAVLFWMRRAHYVDDQFGCVLDN